MSGNDSGVAVAEVDAVTPAQVQDTGPAGDENSVKSLTPQPTVTAPVVVVTPTTAKEAAKEEAVVPTVTSSNIPSNTPAKDSSPVVPVETLTDNCKKSEGKENSNSNDEKLKNLETNAEPQPKETTLNNNTSTSNSEPASSSEDKPGNATSSVADNAVKTTSPPPKPVATIKPMIETVPSNSGTTVKENSCDQDNPKLNKTNPKSNKRSSEDVGEESDKRMKPSSAFSGSRVANKTPEQILEYMEKTFEQRRKMITKQMPTIPELKSSYPELFQGKQLLLEFERITKIDIDQKIQEFCVRYATAVIEMARSNKAAAPVLARWEKAKQENETLKQYWDMVTALCLLPLHFGENFVEMVLEIEEDEEVKAQGKIVPTLVARGNIFRTDEFFLIAENTIVQEFEEFTIAFASLYSSYWVFNMVYPETIENTYNYIQRCIVRQREPGAISAVCKNFTKSLQKWNKEKEGK